MTIHAELIYLSEEIAEEMGSDHVWVDQLRNLAEEVDESDVGDGWEIGGMPLNKGNLMDVVESMAGQLNNSFQAAQPISHFYDSNKYKDLIIADWLASDRRFSQVQIAQSIGKKYNIDSDETIKIIEAYEIGELDKDGKDTND